MDAATARPSVFPLRAAVWVFVSLAGTAAGITLLFLGMRAVMEIGGACAEGGPYVPARPCPEGVPLAMIGGIWGGIAFLGIYVDQAAKNHVPSLVALAWPALFLSLGWNFLEFGLDGPDGSGLVWGWLVCAALFFLMGAGPLLVVAKPVLRSFNRNPRDTPVALTQPLASMTGRRFKRLADELTTAATQATTAPKGDPGGLVTKLEHLDRLHRSGALTDDEFAAAKRRLLEGS